MKNFEKLLTIFIALSISLLSCKKDENNPNENDNNEPEQKEFLFDVKATENVKDITLMSNVAMIEIEANTTYTITCSGEAKNNNNGGDDLFNGVVIYYQDKDDSDGNNSVYKVLKPGEEFTTKEIYGGNSGIGKFWAFFIESNDVASNNSGSYKLEINGTNSYELVVSATENVKDITLMSNVAMTEIEANTTYTITCSGEAKNNNNGGDDLFNGVVIYYQDKDDSDGNNSVYKVLKPGEEFTTKEIYGGNSGIGKFWAFFIESNDVASNNSGSYEISGLEE